MTDLRAALDALDVRTVDAGAAWTRHELAILHAGFDRIPQEHKRLLKGLYVVRDKGSGPADTHTRGLPCGVRTGDEPDPRHIHFSDDAFRTPAGTRAVVREVAHLLTAERTDPAARHLVASGRVFDAGTRHLDSLTAALPAPATVKEEDLAITAQVLGGPIRNKVRTAAAPAVDACHRLEYPGRRDPRPQPGPGLRQELLNAATVQVRALRSPYRMLRRATEDLGAALAAHRPAMRPGFAAAMEGMVEAARGFDASLVDHMEAAIAFAGAHRTLDMFVRLAGTPRYDYTAEERFADTYALVVLGGAVPGPLREWFDRGCPGPYGLEPLGSDDPPPAALFPALFP
jgi:hypothetical protein